LVPAKPVEAADPCFDAGLPGKFSVYALGESDRLMLDANSVASLPPRWLPSPTRRPRQPDRETTPR
jgi:hypothetical protein